MQCHQDLAAALRITLKISIKITAATESPVAMSQSLKPNSCWYSKDIACKWKHGNSVKNES